VTASVTSLLFFLNEKGEQFQKQESQSIRLTFDKMPRYTLLSAEIFGHKNTKQKA
jgi:hypothetical protein